MKRDLTAIRLFFSFIAISLAGMFHDAQALTTITDNITPIEALIKNDLQCPIPYSVDGCTRELKMNNFCSTQSEHFQQSSKANLFLNSGSKPICSQTSSDKGRNS